MDSNEAEPLVDEACRASDPLLPPLPVRNPNVRWQQIGGACMVYFWILCFNAIARFLPALANEEPAWFWTWLARIMGTLSVIAMTSHAMLLLADPGIIRRSKIACRPIPAAVSECLLSGEGLEGLSNQEMEGQPSVTFCVRCCVWRRPPVQTHACGVFVQAACPDVDRAALSICKQLELSMLGGHAPCCRPSLYWHV